VVEDALERGRVACAEIVEIQPGDFVTRHFFRCARQAKDILFEIFQRARGESVAPETAGEGKKVEMREFFDGTGNFM